MAEAILFCGNQCLALRGDQKTLSEENVNKNQGNFLAALKMLAKHDKIVHDHLYSLGIMSAKNARYTSPRIQNEIINIISNDIIRKHLVSEIKKSGFFSIMADEVTSHNKEQLSLCIRFVDESKDIREEFFGFLQLGRITGRVIANTILETLDEHHLDLSLIRGQGYDGAANMSSEKVGVQKIIRENASDKAVYVHCSSHCLNLVIAHSCNLISVQNMLDKLKKCCMFFLNSPKREGMYKFND